jgi:hypothetical protein
MLLWPGRNDLFREALDAKPDNRLAEDRAGRHEVEAKPA